VTLNQLRHSTTGPRTGFAHNCYAGGLGMFFQKTIKNDDPLEKFLDQGVGRGS